MVDFKSIRNLFGSKSKALFLFFRFFIVMVCVGLALSSFEEIEDSKHQEELFKDKYPLYSLMGGGSTDLQNLGAMYTKDGADYLKDSKAFIKRLKDNKDVEVFTQFGVLDDLARFTEDDLGTFTSSNVGSYGFYKLVFFNDNTFNFYDFNISDGRGFSEEDYLLKDDENIPVILGSDFKEFYKVGDVFAKDYNIVGFLEKGSTITVPTGESSYGYQIHSEVLDNIVVAPFNYKDFGAMEYLDGFIKFKNQDAMNGVLKELSDSKLGDSNFIPVDVQFEDFYKDTNELALVYSMAAVLVTAFAVVGFISYLLTIIGENREIFGLYFISGGKKKEVYKLIVGFVAIVLTASMIPAVIIFRSGFVAGFLAILIIVLTAIISFLPIKRVFREKYL